MWVPFWTLFKKEVIRFLKVWMHTVLAPVLMTWTTHLPSASQRSAAR